MSSTELRFIIKGRKLALPSIYNLDTDIICNGKNIGDWGWSELRRVARFINDRYLTMGVTVVPMTKPHEEEFVFDRFGLLNGHSGDGRALVTWINILNYMIMGQKPTNQTEYDRGLHVPSGWVSKINEALSKGIVSVHVERQKTLTGVDSFKIFGKKYDGTRMEVVNSGTSIHFLPPQR